MSSFFIRFFILLSLKVWASLSAPAFLSLPALLPVWASQLAPVSLKEPEWQSVPALLSAPAVSRLLHNTRYL